ncbi:type III toxin-antitoxin system CptIN family toxin [Fusobacterium animalis]|uniref:type III toxin-antitoxin system CptIN family toxin n=1 Tax=Fusobacterium animalis TaxID=76859 RepID=UPI0034DF302B
MKIKKNGFYLIKDEFFKKMNDSSLPLQKNGRPMYYCIEDKNNKNIFWVIPMTTKMDKVNRIITQEGGEDKCKIYVINSSEKNSAFNIQDIFPIKENYIEREYTKNGVHYLLKNKALIEKVEKRAKDIISSKMTKKEIGKNEINIRKIYKTLEKELILENSENQVKNYNCFTGEPINIQNHSSGENKWIGKKDVEKLEIEKKDNVKEKIGKIAVMMTEKEMEDYKKNRGMETKEITNPSNEKKLYIIPVPYYNVSDLKITKEIEKKFVPMKKKEKTIEKNLDKGIER